MGARDSFGYLGPPSQGYLIVLGTCGSGLGSLRLLILQSRILPADGHWGPAINNEHDVGGNIEHLIVCWLSDKRNGIYEKWW